MELTKADKCSICFHPEAWAIPVGQVGGKSSLIDLCNHCIHRIAESRRTNKRLTELERAGLGNSPEYQENLNTLAFLNNSVREAERAILGK